MPRPIRRFFFMAPGLSDMLDRVRYVISSLLGWVGVEADDVEAVAEDAAEEADVDMLMLELEHMLARTGADAAGRATTARETSRESIAAICTRVLCDSACYLPLLVAELL
mmetsp:Transcript_10752/g.21784  ORF Transcript_10752/g.21784 Transcript_10752/m.21784 type:complete len:110 (-) Transcript_10752:8-337(-)